MNILFINPSLRRGSKTKYLPVGVASVMTVVRRAGIGFDLLDVDVHDYEDAYIEEYLKTHGYDLVLFGCIVTHYKWAKWLTSCIKKHQPRCRVIVGNSVAGSIPELFLATTPADVVVIGEGEYTTLDVVKAFESNGDLAQVAGIAYRTESGEVRRTAQRPACDINELPMIDWGLFDIDRYFEITDAASAFGIELVDGKKWRTMPISTARGCISKCTFCHYVFWNDPYRHRTADSIIAEVTRNIEEYGANYINFWDDLSFSSVNQAELLVDKILASGLKFYWSAAVRTDLFGNPQVEYQKRLRVAEKFKEAGCITLGYSLESGSSEILKMMEKKVKVEYFDEQVRLLQRVGITSNTSVVFGYPIETRETIAETFAMCAKSRIYPSIGFLLPLPATGMYRYAKEHGFITDEDAFLERITERQDICLNMTKLSDDEILQEIERGAQALNEMLKLGLSEDHLVRTGGYRHHSKPAKVGEDARPLLGPENLKRNENDLSLNYSQATFDINPAAQSSSGPRKG